MQSTATTITAYLEEVSEARRPVLEQLRRLCCDILKGFDESMCYGMACYIRNGEAEVAFASQKQYISLYILRTDVMQAHRALLQGKGISVGKGCIRYSSPGAIDFAVVAQILQATQSSQGLVC